jgi:1,4-dihydroxy-2-naphthoate polyprenyltransferase
MRKKFTPWIMAARPKTLTAAFVPVFIATILAKKDLGTVNWELSIYAFFAAVFVQLGTNLINDALDFKKGADTEKRIGPVRVTQSGLLSYEQVMAGGMMCFAAALLFGLPLMLAGGWPLTIILLISVLCGYLYTGGPFPLAYTGLGDLFVLIFFGFVATCSVYFVQTGYVAVQAILAGAQVGLFATVLIAINNMRDVVGDAKANKRTLPVRFGIPFAKLEVTMLLGLAFLINLYWFYRGDQWAGLLPFAAAPIAVILLKGIWEHPPGRVYNSFLGQAALLHILVGLLLGIGLILG